jgi:hypothetical protein
VENVSSHLFPRSSSDYKLAVSRKKASFYTGLQMMLVILALLARRGQANNAFGEFAFYINDQQLSCDRKRVAIVRLASAFENHGISRRKKRENNPVNNRKPDVGVPSSLNPLSL